MNAAESAAQDHHLLKEGKRTLVLTFDRIDEVRSGSGVIVRVYSVIEGVFSIW